MRLRVTIQRHGLPATNILWTSQPSFPQHSASHKSATVSQLVDDINAIVPLESGEWGLEDYVVEVGGYECLHFQPIDVLQENDQILIRPLLTSDIRQRTITGRHQVSSDGRHLIDGVPYGRPYLRKTERPEIPPIPSRKRKRTDLEQDPLHDESNSDSGAVLPQYLGRHLITAGGEAYDLTDDGDEEDEDFTRNSSTDEEGEDNSDTDLEKELHDIQADLDNDESETDTLEQLSRPSKRRKTRASSQSVVADGPIQPLIEHHRRSSLASSERNGGSTETKISKSVSFVSQPDVFAQRSSEIVADNVSSSDETSDSEASLDGRAARNLILKKTPVAESSETSDSEESSDESSAGRISRTKVPVAENIELTSSEESSDDESLAGYEPTVQKTHVTESSSEESSDSEISEREVKTLVPHSSDSSDEDHDSYSSRSDSHNSSSSEESSQDSESDNDDDPPGNLGGGQGRNSGSSSEESSSDDGPPSIWGKGKGRSSRSSSEESSSEDDARISNITGGVRASDGRSGGTRNQRRKGFKRASSAASYSSISASDSSDSDIDFSNRSKISRFPNTQHHYRKKKGKRRPSSASESSSSEVTSDESSDDSESSHSSESRSSDTSSSASSSSVSSSPAVFHSKAQVQQQTTQFSDAFVQPKQSAPGQGLKKTKNNNKRQQKRRLLNKLKAQGILHKDASFEELRHFDALPLPQGVPDDVTMPNDKDDLEARKEGLLGLLEAQIDQTADPQVQSKSTEQAAPSERNLLDRISKDAKIIDRDALNAEKNQTEATQSSKSKTTTPARDISTSGSVSEPVQRRSRLDIESSRRLVFGSLGVRTPRSKSAERQLMEKFASEGKRRPIVRSTDVKTAAEPPAEPEKLFTLSKSQHTTSDWHDKLIISAVECQHDGINMSVPPFPFLQGWDQQAIDNIQSLKGQPGKSGKKPKRDWQEIGRDEKVELRKPADASIEHSSPTDNGAIRDQLMRENHDLSALSPREYSTFKDLPTLPEDVSKLSDLTLLKAAPGAVIAYQILQMGPDFQPFMSDYLTAKIESISDDGTMDVKMAHRDQKSTSMPNLTGLDESENEEDVSDVVQIQFDSMYGPKLVQEAPATEFAKGTCLNSVEYNQYEQGEETSRTLSHGDSQVQEVGNGNVDNVPKCGSPAVTTPRRQEISAMMTEAGFDSGINSELRPQASILADQTLEEREAHDSNDEPVQSDSFKRGDRDLPDRSTINGEQNFESISEPVFAGFDSSPRPLDCPNDAGPTLKEDLEVAAAVENSGKEEIFIASIHYPSLPPASESEASHLSPTAQAIAADRQSSPSHAITHDSQATPLRASPSEIKEPHAESLKSTVEETEPSITNSCVANPFHISYSQSDGAAFSEDDDFSELPSIGNLVSSARSPDVSPSPLKIAHRKRKQSPRQKSLTPPFPSSPAQMTSGRTRSGSRFEQPVVREITTAATIDGISPSANEEARESQRLNITDPAASQVPQYVVDLTLDTSSSPTRSGSPGIGGNDDSEYTSSQNIKAELSSQQSQRKLSLRRRTRGSDIVKGWKKGRRVDGSQRSSW